MKYLYQLIGILVLWLLLFCSCSTVRKKSFSSVESDSSTSFVNSYSEQGHFLQLRDTLIPFSYKSVGRTFTAAQLQPLFTAQGKPTERTYRIDTNGLRATITAMIDGSISVQCEADSYKVLVQNMMREIQYLRSNKDSIANTINRRSDLSISTKVKRFALANIIPLALIAIVLFFGILNLIKNKK